MQELPNPITAILAWLAMGAIMVAIVDLIKYLNNRRNRKALERIPDVTKYLYKTPHTQGATTNPFRTSHSNAANPFRQKARVAATNPFQTTTTSLRDQTFTDLFNQYVPGTIPSPTFTTATGYVPDYIKIDNAYHGTSGFENLKSIIREGFQAGIRAEYGMGIYFTTDWNEALGYSGNEGYILECTLTALRSEIEDYNNITLDLNCPHSGAELTRYAQSLGIRIIGFNDSCYVVLSEIQAPQFIPEIRIHKVLNPRGQILKSLN